MHTTAPLYILLGLAFQRCVFAMSSSNPPTANQLPELGVDDASLGDEGLLTIRLYLVRHGETEANRKRIAAGQMESPLSELGMQQAAALKTALDHLPFDAFVVSDMERTQHTARVVVPKPAAAFILEPRLREMAKGAREGFPKAMAYDDALKLRQQISDMKNVPKLESDEDVWVRVAEWLMEMVRDVTALYQGESSTESLPSRTYSILTITHAGVIRTLCAKLVPDQLPNSVDVSAMGRDGSTQNHLQIPNTSVTVVDLIIRDQKGLGLKKKIVDGELLASDLIDVKLRMLSWNDHLR
jgi:broad specificity phosphatase PhoE